MLPEVCVWDLGSIHVQLHARTFLEHAVSVAGSWPLTRFQAKNLIKVPLTWVTAGPEK